MNKLIKRPITLPENIEELKKFVLIGRDKLISVRAYIRAMDKIGVAKAVREQKREEANMLAGALLDAEARMGEILKNIDTDRGGSIDGKKGGSRKTIPEGITHKQSSAFQTLAENKDIIEQVKSDAEAEDDLPTRTEVLRRVKDKAKNQRKRNERAEAINDIEIRKGDFKKVLADIKDIDAIITDPPYPKEFIQCYSDLSKYASEHLKEKGFLAAYSGQYNLPEVINRLSEHLTYVWTFCLYHAGKTQLVNGVNIMCGWKPVLIFSRGCKKMKFSVYDVLISEAREKESHEWQQNKDAIKPLIEVFTKPGELIVDPFAGSGSFGISANELGRRFIGAELNG